MARLRLSISGDINTSLQVGDKLYIGYESSNPALIGTVNEVSGGYIYIQEPFGTPPVIGDYILFAKDNTKNLSGVLGYYAEVNIRTNAATQKELYAVSSEIKISSK
jgi:hypothetical protein